MVKCKFEFIKLVKIIRTARNFLPLIGDCPFEALPGEKYCYWHLKKEGKDPTNEKLQELKNNEVYGVFLKRAKLNGRDLEEASLQFADLSYANLQKAKLSEANLEDADLREADLEKANLWNANLRGANLQRAYLRGAELTFVNFEKANLRHANLSLAKLVGAILMKADLTKASIKSTDLRGSDLTMANLKEANLRRSLLQGAILKEANLQGADLHNSFLIASDLSEANIKEANLMHADIRRANMYCTKVDINTRLDNADLRYANLYHSYLDEAKSLRYAKIFDNEVNKEINEVIADIISKKNNRDIVILDLRKILYELTGQHEDNYYDILEEYSDIDRRDVYSGNESYIDWWKKIYKYVYYVYTGDPIVIYNLKERKIVMLPGSEDENEEYEYSSTWLNDFLKENDFSKYIYKRRPLELYEASYEVYSNLYNFYQQNSMPDKTLEMHYKKHEVRRKILANKGGLSKVRSWVFDFLVLKLLTGYGTKIVRPLIASILIIFIFAFLYWITKGAIKIINGKPSPLDFFDYIYYSVVTFVSLGYSNIQPNIAVGHIPQLLVAIESLMGALMIALMIFVITYRVSH